jgi:hypothetical protein
LDAVKDLRVNLVLAVLFLTLPSFGDIIDLTFTYFAYAAHPVCWFVNEAAFSFKMDVITHGYLFAAVNAISHNAMAAFPLLATCTASISVAHFLQSEFAERACLVVAMIASAAIFALHLYGGLSWSVPYC